MHPLIVGVLLCISLCVLNAQQISFGTYLFLDDSLLQSYKGMYFQQHTADKKGAVILSEYDWENVIHFYTSTLKVSENDYRIYYSCFGPWDAAVSKNVSLCLAISEDGITFKKPSLGLFPYGDDNNTENNIVWTVPNTAWGNSVNIDLNPEAPADELFKLTYDLPDRYLKIAASPDGIHFHWLASPGIANQFADTQTCLLWNPNNATYVAFGRIDNNYGRDDSCPGNYNSYRNVATSLSTTNMTGFEPETRVYSWDYLDPPCVDPYNPAAILYPLDPPLPSYVPSVLSPQKYTPAVYMIFPSYTLHLTNVTTPFVNPYTLSYGHNDNLLDIHFAYSYTGLNFTYVTKEPFINRGIGFRNFTTGVYNTPGSEWDSGFTFLTRGIFQTPTNPNTLTLYYYGTQLTHTTADKIQNFSDPATTGIRAIGRAEIRRDGFVSLTTDYNLPMPQGAFTTKPVILPDVNECGENGVYQLLLNIETSVSGFVTVEIQNTAGQAYPGFSTEDCVPIKGNFVRVPVMWNVNQAYNSDLRKIAALGQPVVFSFILSHTKIYAYEIACNSQ